MHPPLWLHSLKAYSLSTGCCSVTKSCLTLCHPMDLQQNARVIYPQHSQTQVHSTISSSATLFFFCLQYFPASGSFQMSQAFSIRWPKYWSFTFSISPSNEYSGLISFRIDWFDLLAAQWTLKSLLQHNSKHQLFGAQPSLWFNSHIHT